MRRAPFPWVTEVGVGAFFGVAVVLMLLRPDFDPLRRYVSEYAVGWGGGWMRGGFVLLGLGSLNLVPGFSRGERGPEGGGRIGGFLTLWGAAVLVAAAFPVDLQEGPRTGTGTIHLVASLVAFVSLFVAMAVGSRRFGRSPDWRPVARATRWAAFLTPLSFVLEASVFATLGWVGVGQWLLFGLAGGWLILLSRRFRRLGAGPASSP